MSLGFYVFLLFAGTILGIKLLYSLLGGWGIVSLIILIVVWALLEEAFK